MDQHKKRGTDRVKVAVKGLPFVSFLLLGACAPLNPLSTSPEPVLSQEVKDDQRSSSRKIMTGAVTFRGLNSADLNDFRVIPESGRVSFTPRNQHYSKVDGFWWRGDRKQWFKIPDHGEAWVLKAGQSPPQSSDGSVRKGELEIFWRSNPALRWVGMMGGVPEPGFYPKAGRTNIGVPYPF